MELCFTGQRARRCWTVELRQQPGGPVLICRQCVHGGQRLNGSTARTQALAHLALHARRDVLPPHLRTCECHKRGCSWHPRHRGCHGPIRLLLTRECGGRLWRLTDVCVACAAATAQAAVVPETVLAAAAATRAQAPARQRRCSRGPDSRTRVREMLDYLASALPSDTSAGARLIALQCALRMNDAALVRLPRGMLRSLRLEPASDAVRELVEAGWLRILPSAERPVRIRMMDAALLAHHPARPDRLQAADWALRVACRSRPGSDPLPMLVTLCLASRYAPGSARATTEMERLTRECGVPRSSLLMTLDHLARMRLLTYWIVDQAPEDLRWTLTRSVADA